MERHVPTRWSTLVFLAKAAGLQVQRGLSDWLHGLRRHPRTSRPDGFQVVAECRTPLWLEQTGPERALQLGKVHNLRQAVRRLDGVLVPADTAFSFWKQVGRTSARRGYAVGRMLREGCMIPTVGGGLCQLSNALYQVAVDAGCTILERHAHSQAIPGSAAAAGRDATVAWNYIDLRFSASQPFHIEATLSHSELRVRLHAAGPLGRAPQPPVAPAPEAKRSCGTCNEVLCFMHRPAVSTDDVVANVMNEAWPEFKRFLQQTSRPQDIVCVPMRRSWPSLPQVESAPWEALRRSLQSRRLGRYGARRLQAELDACRRLAEAFGRRLPPEATHVRVAQSLLPFLWQDGWLGGRTFDVFLTRLPLAVLHDVLDAAARSHSDRYTLREFRAPQALLRAEREALAAASRVYTPHADLARRFPDRAVKLPWVIPPVAETPADALTIGFPGPTVARKGAYELREALQGLDAELWLSGSELEGDAFWQGLRVRRVPDVTLASVVVQPALLEDLPRPLLKALARGRRVVATPACGLDESPNLLQVPYGDAGALREAIQISLQVFNPGYATATSPP